MKTLEKPSLFWDVDVQTLDTAKHGRFIIERILSRGDMDDIAWMKGTYDDNTITDVLRASRTIDPRSLNFWCNYFSVSPETCTAKHSRRTPSAFSAR